MCLKILFKQRKVERKMVSEAVDMALPEIEFFGDIDQDLERKALQSIHQYEEQYFSLSEKLGLKKMLNLFGSISKPDTAPAPEIKPEEPKHIRVTEEPEPKTQAPQKRKSAANKLQEKYAKAKQVYLREEGFSITGTFIGSGNRQTGTDARFVVYLNVASDGVCYIAGTHFQELVHTCKEGDYIQITKIKNYRKAKERKHSSPAIFDIEVIESAPSEEN